MGGSLYISRKYLTPLDTLYLLDSQIRRKMENFCYICVGAAWSSLSNHDRVEKRLRGLVGNFLVPPVKTRRSQLGPTSPRTLNRPILISFIVHWLRGSSIRKASPPLPAVLFQCGTDSWRDAYPITTVLNFWSRGPTGIYPKYFHNMQPLLPSGRHLLHSHCESLYLE